MIVLTVVYTVAGCAYKHFRIGTQGIESCPNIDFWRELPGLCKDGCIFFWQKCRSLCGGRGGGAEYEGVR